MEDVNLLEFKEGGSPRSLDRAGLCGTLLLGKLRSKDQEAPKSK